MSEELRLTSTPPTTCHSAAGQSISKEQQPAATTKGSEIAAAEPQTFEETVTYTTPVGSNGQLDRRKQIKKARARARDAETTIIP